MLLLVLSAISWSEETRQSDNSEEISEITVKASRVANEQPASSYATPATSLRFDPLTELQSRGIAEGQSDVTVRGGLFENTGFKIGAVTIMDPQTGHYVAELPVDPSLMSVPAIYKGIDSAIEGFNSAIATVSYGIERVKNGGQVLIGAGSDKLNFQSMRFGHSTNTASGSDVGIAVSIARSEGDGSVLFGDHEFARANVQLQHATSDTQTDLMLGYQDKFYGWPGAYTGFASLPEIDDTQTTVGQPATAGLRSVASIGTWKTTTTLTGEPRNRACPCRLNMKPKSWVWVSRASRKPVKFRGDMVVN